MIVKKSGYILVLSLMMVSLCVVLVTALVDRGTVFLPFTATYQHRQQAYMLALSGVQIAKSQLAVVPKQEEAKADQAKQAATVPDEKARATALLQKLFPVLNRWQTFDLTQEKDGIDGHIKLCIMCEDGKIDINALYDFEKQQFAGQGQEAEKVKKVLQELFSSIEKQTQGKNLFQSVEAFLKKRGYPLDDPTQLLLVKGFEGFKNNVFYEPLVSKNEKEKKQLYLTDIFTVWTGKKTVEPWFFSSSVQQILGLRVSPDSKKAAAALKSFTVQAQWPVTWNSTFAQLYETEFAALPKNIDSLLSKKFEPKIFSVLVHGLFDQITQRVFAIVERVEQKSDKGQISYSVSIRKLYWF